MFGNQHLSSAYTIFSDVAQSGVYACLKGNALVVKVPEDEYKVGLATCKNNLHGCLILAKGDASIHVEDLRIKLENLWKPLGSRSLISLGKGFYEFSFASMEDLRGVWAHSNWNLSLGVLRLSS